MPAVLLFPGNSYHGLFLGEQSIYIKRFLQNAPESLSGALSCHTKLLWSAADVFPKDATKITGLLEARLHRNIINAHG